MSHTDDTHSADDIGREGSPQCLRVLQLLHRHPPGLTMVEVGTLAGIFAPHDVRSALTGLRRRGRVVCTGRGRAARWLTTHHARQAGVRITSDQEV